MFVELAISELRRRNSRLGGNGVGTWPRQSRDETRSNTQHSTSITLQPSRDSPTI